MLKAHALPRLKGLKAPRTRAPKPPPLPTQHEIRQKVLTLEDEPTPPGWQSWENWKAYQLARTADTRWQAQVRVGPDRIDVDLVHVQRGLLVFLDGSWTHRYPLNAKDDTTRAALGSQGWQIKAFRYTTREDFKEHLREWWRREIG